MHHLFDSHFAHPGPLYIPIQPPPQQLPQPPHRVMTALTFLQRFITTREMPYNCDVHGEHEAVGLDEYELACKIAALDCLRLYFHGENDYGDAAPRFPRDTDFDINTEAA